MALDKSMKVLVIDDMLTMLKIQKTMLSKIGFTNIHQAKDGAPAWEMIQQAHDQGEPFQFVISDWNMPEMSGIELLRNVRADERFKSLPFLMVTAESEQGNVVEAVKAGVSNYVVKPFTQDTFAGKINKVFGV